jgi:hypothetical protein
LFSRRARRVGLEKRFEHGCVVAGHRRLEGLVASHQHRAQVPSLGRLAAFGIGGEKRVDRSDDISTPGRREGLLPFLLRPAFGF